MTLYKLNDQTEFSHKPKIRLLTETPFSKEIQICLGEGALMKEHKAPGAITIELFSGCIELGSPDSSTLMKPGDIAVFEANILHSLLAKENSIVRLSLSKNDTITRVQNLVIKGKTP